MNKEKITIWGREFEIDIVYDCYPGEEVSLNQIAAKESFFAAIEIFENAKKSVEEYCLKNNHEEIGEESIDNIFKYIIPKSLYVVKNEKKHEVAMMCNYRFDMEHGIAIVFVNEKLYEIGPQDIIL